MKDVDGNFSEIPPEWAVTLLRNQQEQFASAQASMQASILASMKSSSHLILKESLEEMRKENQVAIESYRHESQAVMNELKAKIDELFSLAPSVDIRKK